MLRRRDPVAIGDVGNYTKKQSEDIKSLMLTFENDINSIKNSYQGTDADALVERLLSDVNTLNNVTEVLDYAGDYMKTLAGHDRDNLLQTKKSLASEDTSSTEPLLNQTLNLDDVLTYDEMIGDTNE